MWRRRVPDYRGPFYVKGPRYFCVFSTHSCKFCKPKIYDAFSKNSVVFIMRLAEISSKHHYFRWVIIFYFSNIFEISNIRKFWVYNFVFSKGASSGCGTPYSSFSSFEIFVENIKNNSFTIRRSWTRGVQKRFFCWFWENLTFCTTQKTKKRKTQEKNGFSAENFIIFQNLANVTM